MAINPYFASTLLGQEEQALMSSLYQESIQIQGYEIFYLPRETVNLDYLYGEDISSKFTIAIGIEAYIKTLDNYGGGDTLAKFGLDIQDELTLQIHITRFKEEVTDRFNDIIRPREGDLVYFGIDKHSIFEISFVENKVPFYVAGSLYVYELSLKRFVYGAEDIHTEKNEIDDITEYGSNVTLVLGTLESASTDYISGEVVYQSPTNLLSDSTASGEVLEVVDGVLRLHKVKGVFKAGLNLIGDLSNTEYTFTVKSDETFDDSSTDKVADNINVRKESNSIIDYSEDNPFSDNEYV